jgi:hypothetical protein
MVRIIYSVAGDMIIYLRHTHAYGMLPRYFWDSWFIPTKELLHVVVEAVVDALT